MIKYYYDFHIHTALSPCAENDMTPNNIVNMALLSGLDVIAVSDHNSVGNVLAVMQAAKALAKSHSKQLLVLAAMELETAESIHVLLIFPSLLAAEKAQQIVNSNMPLIKNKQEIYGNQYYLDSNDNVVKIQENLLVVSTSITLEQAQKIAADLGGVALPAHVDKPSNAIIAILGAITPDMGFYAIEVSPRCSDSMLSQLSSQGYKLIYNSDAHLLENINQQNSNFLELESLTESKVIAALTNIKN